MQHNGNGSAAPALIERDARALQTTQEFSGVTRQHAMVETASTALAAQNKAMVEARYIMALQRPRNGDQVRAELMNECRRPSFAHNKSAFYVKPIGDGVEGLGIRFVEVALRCMTNVLVETTTVYEDDQKEIVRVATTDLERNVTYPMDVKISKTVERRKPMDDGSYISVRTNSYGKPVYTVPATDDEILNKRNALISKTVRTLGLRLIPGDLQDEAEEIIKRVRLDKAAADPGAERKRITDAFAEIGVMPTMLVEYLGHSLDSCSPAELVRLRGIYGAIKDGEATWKTVMENKGEGGEGDEASVPTYPDAKFAKDLPKWLDLIRQGKKSAADIIATAESKFPLTDEQKAQIRAGEKQPEKASGAPPVTYALVADKISKAANVDQLAEAADLINAITDAKQRTELSSLYEARRTALEASQQ